MASPILQGAPKDGFGDAVMVCDMPESCKFPSLNSCQRRFQWSHKEVDLAPHTVVGLVLKVGDTKKFPRALGFESLDHFLFFSFFFSESTSRTFCLVTNVSLLVFCQLRRAEDICFRLYGLLYLVRVFRVSW